MTLPHKSFYYMRHGQTDWNKTHKMMGQTDIPLNETGIAQAKDAVKLLDEIEIASIVTSPLLRAKQTAEVISGSKGIPLTIIDELKEACWGVLEGELKGDGSWLDKWRNGDPIDEAELSSDFTQRVFTGLKKALELPGPVLIVSHGMLYWRVAEILSLPIQHLENCAPIYHRPPSRKDEPWFVCSLEGV